jgi:arginyl-tRNA synthetase
VTVSLAEFDKTYARLGVRFDTVYGESHYHPRLAPLVEELLAKGIAEESRGAVICNVEGAPAPLLIRKADGSFLYGTTDLATIEQRVRDYQPRAHPLHRRHAAAASLSTGVLRRSQDGLYLLAGAHQLRLDAL